jgi:hypothetical protein
MVPPGVVGAEGSSRAQEEIKPVQRGAQETAQRANGEHAAQIVIVHEDATTATVKAQNQRVPVRLALLDRCVPDAP